MQDDGPFVYRLGRQVFNLERAVRFCYGLQKVNKTNNRKSKHSIGNRMVRR